ncbi:DUF1842 domain-containing protein [Flavobacterium hercynium]|uniref:DUF1842 domain-containing protein n=1 Tax=Flavobacterium hercynium TaxID=387094 RepID=A0A226HEK9_9FLAO|nr:DUF1842 domain-containing protein [Flavobacterium hercynium]OXA92096.1 hypothetical protein B0A66_10020 [Flavobacterium hercynium]SMP25012.1 protein of unknown function [Flavobacterium hercynium]
MSELLIGAYLAEGKIGNVGTPGAPIAKFSLVVVPSQNSVSGTVVISQAVNGPDSHIVVQVKGRIYATGFGKYTKAVSLQGQYVQSFPPPALGAFIADFDAHFSVDDEWNGIGGFSYWRHSVENVPVASVKQGELV